MNKMNGSRFSQFFLTPQQPIHRRSEALRAVFVDDESMHDVALRFDVSYGIVRNWVSEFFRTHEVGEIPLFLVSANRGFGSKQTDDDVDIPVADVQALSLERGRRLITRHAGIFLFLPLLAQMRFDLIVTAADDLGTQMIPAVNALLSLIMADRTEERCFVCDDSSSWQQHSETS